MLHASKLGSDLSLESIERKPHSSQRNNQLRSFLSYPDWSLLRVLSLERNFD